MTCIEWICVNGVENKIKLVATNNVRFGTRALVFGGPVMLPIDFHLVQKLICPQLGQFLAYVFGNFLMSVTISQIFDDGKRFFGSVDHEIHGNVEERINEFDGFFNGATFGIILVHIVAGGDERATGRIHY
jgi:hypothetical protein